MNCPVCGKPIYAEQHFCRECGAELIARQPSRIRAAGLFVLALIFVGLLTAMGGKMFEMRWLAYLGLVVMMTGAFAIAAYGLMRETRPKRRAPKNLPGPAPVLSVEKADTTNKLISNGREDYVPTVVEDTTELLKTPVRRA